MSTIRRAIIHHENFKGNSGLRNQRRKAGAKAVFFIPCRNNDRHGGTGRRWLRRPHSGLDYYICVRQFLMLPGILLLVALTACYSGGRPPRIGTTAPDFTVRDSDREVTLSGLRGKVVVLNFWATWCPPCVQETPSLVKMQQRLKDKGVLVLAVSVDADESAYRRFIKDHNMDLLTVRDADQKSNALYGTSMFPETYVIDRQGVVRRKFIGAVDWNSQEITEFLAKL